MKTQEVRARIDPHTKEAAEAVFSKLGVSPSEAVRMFYHQVELKQGFPFEVRVPNAETARSFEDALAGRGLASSQTFEEFSAELDDL